MTDKTQGFWSSIPGILTGIAAVITAFTGLYHVIYGGNSSSQPDISIVGDPLSSLLVSDDGSMIIQDSSSETKKVEQQAQGGNTTSQLDLPTAEDPISSPLIYGERFMGNQDSSSTMKKVEQPVQEKKPFPKTGPLVDCMLFPTIDKVNSLMNWSNYYHKQIITAEGVKRRASAPCNQAIDQRGMAHCKAPDNIEIRQALLETLTLCRATGIEWQDIQHSTIIGNE